MYIVGCVSVGVNQIGTGLEVNLVIGYWSLSNVYSWLCVCWCYSDWYCVGGESGHWLSVSL